MNRKIRMATTAAGPDATFQSDHVYEVGTQITPEQAAAFVNGRYASYETADGKPAPERTTANPPDGGSGGDVVTAFLAQSVAKIKDGVADLSDDDLQAALDAETAKGEDARKGALDALSDEIEERTAPTA